MRMKQISHLPFSEKSLKSQTFILEVLRFGEFFLFLTPQSQLIFLIHALQHSILHLLYARFIMKFLKSQNLTTRSEPFPNLITQGLVLGQTYRDKATGKPIPSAEGKAIPPSEVIYLKDP